MGIEVEFNPQLALRNRKELLEGRREHGECIPENLEKTLGYGFLKKGRRIYFQEGEIPLVETDGKGNFSRPLASILIFEVTYFMKNKEIYTKGRYDVKEVYDINDPTIHFEGFDKVK